MVLFQDDIYDFNDDDDKDYSDHENETTSKRSLWKYTPKSKARNGKTPRKSAPQIKTPQKEPPQKFSFIKDLKKKYPEMAKDEQLLVEHLASVMRETRPPEPPENYCKVITNEGPIKYE